MPPLTTSPRPQPRPETATSDNPTAVVTSSPTPQPRPDNDSDGSPTLVSSPIPRPRPESSSDDDDAPSSIDLGTPELYQPKVRAALLGENEVTTEQSVFSDVLFGGDEPLDVRVADLTHLERMDLSFDQRFEAGVGSTILGMGTADAMGVVKNALPTALKFPAQVLIGTGVGRATFPPMKEVADWYHGDVRDQPIVDPAPGIFSKENLADFVPGIVSTGAGLGVQALTTTALTGLGVSNPVVLVGAGLGAGVYGAGKAWVWTDEVAIPAVEDHVFETITSGIDPHPVVDALNSRTSIEQEPVTLEELEALYDSVADQIPAAKAEALRPSVGLLAPDTWTIGDIARYESMSEIPTIYPKVADTTTEGDLLSPLPLLVTEEVEPAESQAPGLTVATPAVPVFRTVRTPEVIVEAALQAEPAREQFVPDDDHDAPDPQCLVPYWLIQYLPQLRDLGVQNFCALKDLSRADLEELLAESITEMDESAESVPIDDGPVLVPIFASERISEVQEEITDSDEELSNVFL